MRGLITMLAILVAGIASAQENPVNDPNGNPLDYVSTAIDRTTFNFNHEHNDEIRTVIRPRTNTGTSTIYFSSDDYAYHGGTRQNNIADSHSIITLEDVVLIENAILEVPTITIGDYTFYYESGDSWTIQDNADLLARPDVTGAGDIEGEWDTFYDAYNYAVSLGQEEAEYLENPGESNLLEEITGFTLHTDGNGDVSYTSIDFPSIAIQQDSNDKWIIIDGDASYIGNDTFDTLQEAVDFFNSDVKDLLG